MSNHLPAPKAPLKTGGSIAAIVPQDVEQVFRMSQMIVASGMAPKGVESVEKVTVAIFHGLELGLKPLQALQSIAIVNGRPTVWGDAALALVEASGLLEDIEETVGGEGDACGGTCVVKRIGRTATRRAFTVADAKRAGLWNKSGPWQQYPSRMLQLRARAFALRDAFPDVLRGVSITEEVRDYMRDVTPPQEGQLSIKDQILQQARGRRNDTLDGAIDHPPSKAAEAEKPAPAATMKDRLAAVADADSTEELAQLDQRFTEERAADLLFDDEMAALKSAIGKRREALAA